MKDLSIIVPVYNNAERHLAMVLSRLNLAESIGEHSLEVVVIDRGCTDQCRELCEFMSQHIDLKYIYIPNIQISFFSLANIANEVCEGKVVGLIHVDHFISENIIKYIIEEISDEGLIGRCSGFDNDELSSNVTNQLLSNINYDKKLESILLATKAIGGKSFTCCASKKPFQFPLPPHIDISKNIWSLKINEPNEYSKNITSDWQRITTLPVDMFSIINDKIRDRDEHQKWIKENV